MSEIERFKLFAGDKRIAVLGAGISNRPLIRWLYRFNQNIKVFDRLPQDDPRIKKIQAAFVHDDIKVEWALGSDYLAELNGFDLIFRTPNMRPDHPELVRERMRGAVITSEMALFLTLCPAPITAVTGSDGKTTTTTLISLMLETAGYRTWTGGNIGTPLLDRVESMKADDRVVVELSSFQLMDMHPVIDCAVITNIIPNHLDFHKNFEEYRSAKLNIYRSQRLFDRLVLNAADANTDELIADSHSVCRLFNVNSVRKGTHACFDGENIVLMREGKPEHVVARREVRLPGRFNLDNIMAAVLAVVDDVPVDVMRDIAQRFCGVRHRLEWIRCLDGADWYNSSIDSSPDRTIRTLEALREQGRRVVLIAGGKDKKSDYSRVGEAIVATTSRLVLIGENAPLIETSVREACERGATPTEMQIKHCDSYPEAVRAAREFSEPGDAVVLSPAGTSFDLFHHFEERGDCFCDLVLKENDRNG